MYPTAFTEQMQALLGAEYPDFLAALAEPAPVSIRLNPGKAVEGLWAETSPVPWHPQGRYLPERPVFTLDPLLHAGAYYVQEASSMLLYAAITQLVPLDQPLKVLDLCAAPGGKSTLLSALLPSGSVLIANEVVGSRAKVLLENLSKWGSTNAVVTHHDVRDFGKLTGQFDLVLVDAPCSGEGLFRKTPAAVSEWSEGAVQHCASRQQQILTDAVPLLRPGGTLLYSTCTYNTLENESNARWLQQTWDLEPLHPNFPEEWGLKAWDYGYQCFPHRVKGEGFYLAAFRASEGSPTRRKAGSKVPPGQWRRAEIPAGLLKDEPFEIVQHALHGLAALPVGARELLDFLPRHWPVLKLGRLKGQELLPEPALALSQACGDAWPRIELDESEALEYLRKTGPGSLEQQPKGWTLATHQGLNLGWMKILPNRVNNYWPSEWKIRMS